MQCFTGCECGRLQIHHGLDHFMMQSKAGVENREYKAQRSILADVDAGRLSKEDLFARAEDLMKERLKTPGVQAPGAHRLPAIAPPQTPVIPPARPGGQQPGLRT